jgi:hypothetical protein
VTFHIDSLVKTVNDLRRAISGLRYCRHIALSDVRNNPPRAQSFIFEIEPLSNRFDLVCTADEHPAIRPLPKQRPSIAMLKEAPQVSGNPIV